MSPIATIPVNKLTYLVYLLLSTCKCRATGEPDIAFTTVVSVEQPKASVKGYR